MFITTECIAIHDREMACRRVAPMPAPIMSLTLLSWEGGLTFGDHEFTSITQLQPTNLQDRACRIELADLGLNFSLVTSILLPAAMIIPLNPEGMRIGE